MGKKFVSNPSGNAAPIFVESPEMAARISELEQEIVRLRGLPPKVEEKVVEIVRITDNPRHLEKIKKLEVEISDLKQRGAYRLVKEQVQLLSPNVEQTASESPTVENKAAIPYSKRQLGIAFTVGTFLGAGLVWALIQFAK